MPSRPPKLKPSQLTVILGVLFAIVVATSGIVATITQQHDDSPVTRSDFTNIASPLRALFYTLIESAKLAEVEPAGYLAEATRRAIANPGTVTVSKDVASG